jgi:hypothetical protein
MLNPLRLSQLTMFMPMLDTVSGGVIAPGAVLTAWTMAQGDSAQIRASPDGKSIRMLSLWNKNQVAGQIRILSPRLHDADRGMTSNIVVGNVMPAMPLGLAQYMKSNDNLTIQQSGSAVALAAEIGSFLLWYEGLGDGAARYITPADLKARGVNVKQVQTTNTPTAGATYSGSTKLTTTEDLLKADLDYALIGYEVSALCGTVSWRGTDTGNYRASGPGDPTQKHVTGNWFQRLSKEFDLPLIPVIAANNKNNTFVEIVQDQALTAVVVNSIFVELAPR